MTPDMEGASCPANEGDPQKTQKTQKRPKTTLLEITRHEITLLETAFLETTLLEGTLLDVTRAITVREFMVPGSTDIIRHLQSSSSVLWDS
jgi:hypothetical protein